MVGFSILKREVIKTGLCVRCGTCIGICPVNALDIRDVLGKCEPQQIGKCMECGLCIQTCPGKSFDFGLSTTNQNNLHSHPVLGKFIRIFVGYCHDKDIRHRGASGGMGTAILLHLLDEQEIDGAVVLDYSTDRPYFPEVRLVNDRKDIIKAAQSKYFTFPQNKILKVLRESSFKKVAYFGLPCQVHGIKKALQEGVSGTEKIKYILGCYCGNNLFYEATLSLFKRFGFD
ncbi:MAG: coenzyme F420 hydrogenase/dehydrogenase beta subunit N-terminal domain-containing protein, partial [Thermodesulfobacteriota bacterium]|nr:coenzyme F420 hydrogenase/dehydrogenase beta subunit N-terminal domain-containing protein [Thermodesulfobacteriota bacterium]